MATTRNTKRFYATGRRKTSVARVYGSSPATGKVEVNHRDMSSVTSSARR